jgi:hypothetical protein
MPYLVSSELNASIDPCETGESAAPTYVPLDGSFCAWNSGAMKKNARS